MGYSIIGTAGHVDHGKTRLIQALTGQDTDRLAEEKRRGITIELGFASLPLPDGTTAGIVDVPGHEKFIKNMLAGAGGMDLALLVVAADEGMMPQTREHLGILSLLGLERGLVALTKVDRVDEDWLELAMAEVREELAGSFLAQAPILPVSSVTGEGIPQLREAIWEVIRQSPGRNPHAPFRMAIDRVFTREGFGTVATGTALGGSVREGEELALYPAGALVRVRTLQVHGQPVSTAWAGQRVAVNLAAIKREELGRGDYLAAPGSMTITDRVDVTLRLLPGCGRRVERGDRLHFYHGTGAVLCRAYPLGRELLGEGEEGFCQLRFTQPVALCSGDRFVVRFYSPVETIGGGRVLDLAPGRHKLDDPVVLEGLKTRRNGTPTQLLGEELRDWQGEPPGLEQLAQRPGSSREVLEQQLRQLEAEGTILPLAGRFVHTAQIQSWQRQTAELLGEFHRREPLLAGPRAEELRGRILPSKDAALHEAFWTLCQEEGILRRQGERLALPAFSVRLTPQQKKLRQEMADRYAQAGVEPPSTEELLAGYSPREREQCRALLEAMQAAGALVVIAPQMLMDAQAYQGAWESFCQAAAEGQPVTLGALRDRLGSSRKYVLSLLEQWDRRGMTRKVGEGRLPRSQQ